MISEFENHQIISRHPFCGMRKFCSFNRMRNILPTAHTKVIFIKSELLANKLKFNSDCVKHFKVTHKYILGINLPEPFWDYYDSLCAW